MRSPDGKYRVGGEQLSSGQLVDRYAEIVDRYPVWSIEDGLGEDDRAGWAELTGRLGAQVQLVGDDIFVTDPAFVAGAIEAGLANAVLIKPSQVGTVTETLETARLCRQAGYAQMVSHPVRGRATRSSRTWRWRIGCGQTRPGHPPVARGSQVQPAARDRGGARSTVRGAVAGPGWLQE